MGISEQRVHITSRNMGCERGMNGNFGEERPEQKGCVQLFIPNQHPWFLLTQKPRPLRPGLLPFSSI